MQLEYGNLDSCEPKIFSRYFCWKIMFKCFVSNPLVDHFVWTQAFQERNPNELINVPEKIFGTFQRWDWSFASELDTPYPHWTNRTYHLIQTSSSSCVFSLNHLYLRYFNKKPKLVTFEWFDLSCFWKLQPIFLAEVEKQSYLIASSKNTNQRALKWSDPIGGKVHSFKWTLLGQFYFELCRFGSKKD